MHNPYFDSEYNPYPPSVLIGTGMLFIMLPIACVALRFYARSFSAASLHIDDWITIPCMIICVGLSVTQLIATTAGGLGSHRSLKNGEHENAQRLSVYEKTKYSDQVLGTLGLWMTKISVLLFYRRLFSVPGFRRINNAFIVTTVAWGLAFTLAFAFQCIPVSTIWEKPEPEYGNLCLELRPFYLSLAISDLILDVLVLMLPLPQIWHLKVSLRQRLAIGGTFLLGSVVVASGITRLVLFQWMNEFTEAQPQVYFSDITWYTAGMLFWQLVENVFGLLGSCLPTYAPLFKDLLQKRKVAGIATDSAPGYTRRQYPSRYHRHLVDEVSLTLVDMDGNSSYPPVKHTFIPCQ